MITGINNYRHTKQISYAEAEKAVDCAFGLGVNLIDETPDLCYVALRWTERLDQMAAYDASYLAAIENGLSLVDKRHEAGQQCAQGWRKPCILDG